jgi:hypothetical protein
MRLYDYYEANAPIIANIRAVSDRVPGAPLSPFATLHKAAGDALLEGAVATWCACGVMAGDRLLRLALAQAGGLDLRRSG